MPTAAGVKRKSRFNDPEPVYTNIVGYYKRIKRDVVFIPVPISDAVSTMLTNDMFFEGVEDDDKKQQNDDSDKDTDQK